MEKVQNSPFLSKVLETLKSDAQTLDSGKYQNVEEKGMVTLLIKMCNFGSKPRRRSLKEMGTKRVRTWGEIILNENIPK